MSTLGPYTMSCSLAPLRSLFKSHSLLRGLLPSALHHALSLPCLTSAHPTCQHQLFCCIINITYLYVKSLIVFFCWKKAPREQFYLGFFFFFIHCCTLLTRTMPAIYQGTNKHCLNKWMSLITIWFSTHVMPFWHDPAFSSLSKVFIIQALQIQNGRCFRNNR